MKKVNRKRMDDSSAHNVWRSYSDMMSGLLLLFVLIMAVCLMQAQKNYAEKLAEQAKQLRTQTELEQTQQQVNEQQAQLALQQETLDEQKSTLDKQESTLAEQASALEELQKALENQELILVQKESELDENQLRLEESQAKLDAQSILLKAVEMGLGGLFILNIRKEALRQALDLPLSPLAVIAIGKPAERVFLLPVSGPDEDLAYYRKDGNHYVPKLQGESLLV